MTPITAQEFAQLCHGTLVSVDPSALITGFATDSRSVKPGDLFLAIRGENVDGHLYASTALAHGATAVLAERPVDGAYILVPNLVEALASFGNGLRRRFHGPVFGVTGSAGKTTTKEFLTLALSSLGEVVCNPGNRNTEFTSPLLWADTTPDTKAVVVEMAMRGFGQIQHLARISEPTIGVVTNVGWSHLEQVKTREGVAQAKGELLEALPDDGFAVLWAEDDYLSSLKARCGAKRVRTFGFSESADCRVIFYQADGWKQAVVVGTLDGVQWEAKLPAIGRHLALSAAAAVLAASLAGVDARVAAQSIEKVVLPPMRMEVRDVHGVTVLLDTYNASPPSMLGAIETLADVTPAGHRFAVIGEMRELGDYAHEAHARVGKAIVENGLDGVILVGGEVTATQAAAIDAGMSPDLIRIAATHDEVTQYLKGLRPGDAVLLKGSRALELEKSLEGWS